MMPIELRAIPVVLLYGAALFVILYVAPRLTAAGGGTPKPWWRSSTFWASFVALTQIGIYLVWS